MLRKKNSPVAVSGTFFVSVPLATVFIRAPAIIMGTKVIANIHTLLTHVFERQSITIIQTTGLLLHAYQTEIGHCFYND